MGSLPQAFGLGLQFMKISISMTHINSCDILIRRYSFPNLSAFHLKKIKCGD